MTCPRCHNGGKVNYPGVQVCPADLGSWGHCDCPVGKAVERIESSVTNAEEMPVAVRAAVALGADLFSVSIPRYLGRPEVNEELDRIERGEVMP